MGYNIFFLASVDRPARPGGMRMRRPPTPLETSSLKPATDSSAILTTTSIKLKDADSVKWTLRCLGHLLKTLWRPVSANLNEVYGYYTGLFHNKQPDYIR